MWECTNHRIPCAMRPLTTTVIVPTKRRSSAAHMPPTCHQRAAHVRPLCGPCAAHLPLSSVAPILVNSGQMWRAFGRVWPNLSGMWLWLRRKHRAKLAPNRVEFHQCRRNMRKISAKVPKGDRNRSSSVKTWPNSGRVRPNLVRFGRNRQSMGYWAWGHVSGMCAAHGRHDRRHLGGA